MLRAEDQLNNWVSNNQLYQMIIVVYISVLITQVKMSYFQFWKKSILSISINYPYYSKNYLAFGSSLAHRSTDLNLKIVYCALHSISLNCIFQKFLPKKSHWNFQSSTFWIELTIRVRFICYFQISHANIARLKVQLFLSKWMSI